MLKETNSNLKNLLNWILKQLTTDVLDESQREKRDTTIRVRIEEMLGDGAAVKQDVELSVTEGVDDIMEEVIISEAFSKEWDKKVQQDGPSSCLVPSPSGVAYSTASADDSHDMVQVSSVCFWLQLVGHS